MEDQSLKNKSKKRHSEDMLMVEADYIIIVQLYP